MKRKKTSLKRIFSMVRVLLANGYLQSQIRDLVKEEYYTGVSEMVGVMWNEGDPAVRKEYPPEGGKIEWSSPSFQE
jgi:hypothetical protein